MAELKPKQYVTREECQEMIDKAIDRHNKNATLISAALGSILLFFYAHGLLTVIDRFK
jgi:predicted nucleic acid-binding Zn ribbon protein